MTPAIISPVGVNFFINLEQRGTFRDFGILDERSDAPRLERPRSVSPGPSSAELERRSRRQRAQRAARRVQRRAA